MNKTDLLRYIAEKGYDVGFGAKKHFATYDIIDKIPGLVGFLSTAFGIFALVVKSSSTELTSATFIVLGVMGLYISMYNHKKDAYEKAGVELTKLFNELKGLYLRVKNLDEKGDLSFYQEELSEIESRYYPLCISTQILLSNWYAHYKFFWEQQMGWINEQLKFSFFRDKVPLSLWFALLIGVVTLVYFFVDRLSYLCNNPAP
jgi:uncharacterized membrane protein YuzA (DUF378 family)